MKPEVTAASTLPSPPSASGRSSHSTVPVPAPAAERSPAARASATSPAVRLPLNLSGAMRVRTVFGTVVVCMSAGFRVGGAAVVGGQVVVGVGDLVAGDGIILGEGLDGFAGEDAAGPVCVEGPVPPGDEERGDGVAGEIDQRPALRHELVDAEDEHNAGGRDGADGGQRGGQGNEAAAR